MTAESDSIVCDECKASMEFGINVGMLVFCQSCFDQLQCEAAGLVCEDCGKEGYSENRRLCAYKRNAFEGYLVTKNLLHLIEVT